MRCQCGNVLPINGPVKLFAILFFEKPISRQETWRLLAMQVCRAITTKHEAHEACCLGRKTCAGANAQVFGGSVGQGRIISRLRIGLFIFGAGGQKGGFLALGRLWIFGAQKIGIAVQSLGAGGGGNLASSISYGSGASAQRRGKIV
jgi:hypothetical protein